MNAHSHDPYRAARVLRAAVLDPADAPAEEPVTVLAYVDRYPPFVNAGAEWMLHAMMRHLARQGHRAVVATALPLEHHEHQPVDVEGVEVFHMEHADDLAADADVLVGHLLWTRQVVETADRHGLPLLYLVHNDQQLNHWKLVPENVTVMVWNALWMREAHPRWAGPSTIVRPPVLLDDYHLERDPARGEFVTLVNPNPDKGAGVFYEVARRRPDLRFATVAGGYGQQLRPPQGTSNVERLPATGAIRDDVYARTRVLFVPSRYESWGRVAVEALCSGIPVVAHPTPGLLEALGPAGIFVDRDDTEGWVQALAALDDPGAYAIWSEAARERAEHLHAQALHDLARWDRLIRVAATARRRVQAMPGHDPFRGASPATPRQPAPAVEEAAQLLHAVEVELDDFEPDSDGLVRIDLSDSAEAPLRTWADQEPVGVGDRIRLHDLGDEATWREGTVVEVADTDGAEVAIIVIDGDSAAAEEARAKLRAAAQEPAGDPPPPAPTEEPAAPENDQEPPAPADLEVPTKAADVVAWINEVDGDDQQARREAAWAAEVARPEGVRRTVADVAEPI